MNRATRSRSSRRARLRVSAFTLSAACALLISSSVHSADGIQADQHNDLFVPDKLSYYNPLKHNKQQVKGDAKRYATSSVALSNLQLEDAANQIRTNEMSSQQRALNHQWLEQHHHGDNPDVGSKVLSKLVKMGFRTYWDGVRNKHYSSAKAVPDGNGTGKVSEDVDYKIRLSGNKVKLSFEYEF
ncbi:MAG: hypothetical protein ACRBBW_15120 [Cellvibrionaceae bacterium]